MVEGDERRVGILGERLVAHFVEPPLARLSAEQVLPDEVVVEEKETKEMQYWVLSNIEC